MDLFAQLLTNGIIIGATYALIAIGLSLIFGMMRVVNFAHGEFYMLGAYVAVSAATGLNLGYFISLPSRSCLFRSWDLCLSACSFARFATPNSQHRAGDHRVFDLPAEYRLVDLGAAAGPGRRSVQGCYPGCSATSA